MLSGWGMLNQITLYWLPALYFALFVGALFCSHSWKLITGLAILYFAAWLDPIWYDAKALMLVNWGVFVLLYAFGNDEAVRKVGLLTMVMLICNGIFLLYPFGEFYRLSAINLLFVAQCLLTIGEGHKTLKLTNQDKDGGNGYFMARVLHKIQG